MSEVQETPSNDSPLLHRRLARIAPSAVIFLALAAAFFRGDYLFGFVGGIAYTVIVASLCYLLVRACEESDPPSIRKRWVVIVFSCPLLAGMVFPDHLSPNFASAISTHRLERAILAELTKLFASDPRYSDLSASTHRTKFINVTIQGSINNASELRRLRDRIRDDSEYTSQYWLEWDVLDRATGAMFRGSDSSLFSDLECVLASEKLSAGDYRQFLLLKLPPDEFCNEQLLQNLAPLFKGTDSDRLKVFEKLRQSRGINFHLQGNVVDELGKPLDDVSVDIKKTGIGRAFAQLPPLDVGPKKGTTISRNFDFRVTGGHQWQFRFRKDGYSTRTVTRGFFVELEKKRERERLNAGRNPSQPEKVPAVYSQMKSSEEMLTDWNDHKPFEWPLLEENLQVILQKRLPIKTLTEVSGKLELREDGSGEAVLLDPPANGKPTLAFKSVKPQGSMPPVAIFLQVARDGHGWLREVPEYPKQSSLILAGSSGGFIRFAPTEDTREIPIFAQMQMAPESGYSSELKLLADQQVTYFYFSVNGKFGKGRIYRPRIFPEFVAVSCQLFIESSGDRNLSDIRDEASQ